ncbi:hypothetical protein V1522DRAFT_440077 [Lipomyces starkeyi]
MGVLAQQTLMLELMGRCHSLSTRLDGMSCFANLERDIIPMARHFGMALAPWDVLGGGKFQTKNAIEDHKKKGEGLRSLIGQTEDEVKMSEALSKVASEHGIESVTAIALAYVLSKAPNMYPIVGGRKVEHLRDNILGTCS